MFGDFAYTKTLGLHVLGIPAVLALTWLMIGWPAFVLGRLVGNAPVVGTAIMVGWSLLFDPQMVKAGFWEWKATSWPAINGTPIISTLGRAVTAAMVMFALERLVAIDVSFEGLCVVLLGWTWLWSVVSSLVFGLGGRGSGVVGGLALTAALAPVVLAVIDSQGVGAADGADPRGAQQRRSEP